MNSSYKGFTYPLKGIVTRTDDPNNLGRIQVCIPSYHGRLDDSKKGNSSELGSYPWAQICSISFKDNNNNSSNQGIKGIFSRLFGNSSTDTGVQQPAIPMIYPSIGDVIWLTFEGGDIRCPIYMGGIAEKIQNYTNESAGYANLTISGSIGAIAAEIVYGNESGGKNYSIISPKDVNAISIGLIQWHGNNARDLLKDIKQADESNFNSILSRYSISLDLSKDWSNWYISRGDVYYNTIKEILELDSSKEIQDKKCIEYMNSYIETARACSVSDTDALIYYCDMATQSPAGAKNIAKACTSKDLDTLHNTTLSGGYWLGSTAYNNNERRKRTYNKIKEYKKQGKLDPVSNSNLSNSTSLGGQFLYPVPVIQTYISARYGYGGYGGAITTTNGTHFGVGAYHSGIDIAGTNILGAPIVAVADGVAETYNLGGKDYGRYVRIYHSNNLMTIYGHMNSTQFGFNSRVNVKAGDIIGYVGQSGSATGPHLHFEIRRGPNYKYQVDCIDPLPYIKSGG